MSFLRVEDMHIDLGEFSLKGVSLEFDRGEYLTVMGPTGSGKTILLECIIGFYHPAKGRVFLDGRDITDDPPEKRRIGIVYQDYALLPHKNIFQNIEYGLKKVDSDADSRKDKIMKMADALNINHVLHRKPGTLSGGEQQRAALARALVVEPRLLLMDEPLSALDPQTRHTTRALLRQIMAEQDLTVLHITHDMDDVWALADKVAIMRNGCLEQLDTTYGVFNRPNNRFVADFVGARMFEGTVLPGANGCCQIDVGGVILHSVDSARSGDAVRVFLRPENVMVFRQRPSQSSIQNLVDATLEDYYQEGILYHLSFRSQGVCIPAVITASAFQELDLHRNEELCLGVKAANVTLA
ncbi:ATP-binding cassette domain-containing protein [Pseudodesulfovibrio sp. JC047]|uniref:ATP-binding cassette domain-containing protein n=1 Tax=Pseudodesulfovibrio sp. JC047 TaxID=2683199 RepID=UPI0013D25956|nr:ATP-binding cassette domain-containing protein [Pseudodesulfovibrio sp. JC047]NDV18622.1 ATP-binding cassette domain-containing protein [Pseudodesulfovibrio sp. JC047]